MKKKNLPRNKSNASSRILGRKDALVVENNAQKYLCVIENKNWTSSAVARLVVVEEDDRADGRAVAVRHARAEEQAPRGRLLVVLVVLVERERVERRSRTCRR